MSMDHCQANPQQQLQQRKPQSCDELGDTYSEKVIQAETQRLLTEFEQLELITSNKVDSETHSKSRQKKKKKSLESTMSHFQAHPEQQESTIIIEKTDHPVQTLQKQEELTSTTVDVGTNSEKSVTGQQKKARKSRQKKKKKMKKKKKKSLESTLSTDHSQAHPEQAIIEQQQQQKPSKRGQTKKSLLATMTTDQGEVYPQQVSARIIEKTDHTVSYYLSFVFYHLEQQEIALTIIDKETEQLELTSTTVDGGTNPFSLLYVLEQQESTTKIEKTDHSDESPISSTQPTREGQVPEKSSGDLLDFIRVPKLSEYGTVEYIFIPPRSYWLEIIREDWGATDEEIIACIKAAPQLSRFKIEVCGSYIGHGVIVRANSCRNPIVVKCTVVADRVSPFYHELLGVSLGMKLAMKYKIVYFDLNCVSEVVAEYVMRTWDMKNECGCPPRDKKDYCVKCSESMLDDIGERQNADKISAVVDEIFYDALEEGFLYFYLYPIKLSRAKAVCYLANSGVDRELRIPEIEEDAELAEILYKEVFGHGSEEEVGLQKQQLILRKQERKLQKQKNLAAERACQESLWGQ
ncbi:uncharacterized protein LOC113290197 isoform X2 [Papaver somniferum]|uniref:uncharacterized protein LOC113290197 isoform X2 n=1 Tax=Papaver somniferum TaxID=3469 RepID=UPI000E6F6B24|nr:uncharacterized protein LOC113290197 isoform X2 [Papaver somniferum]